MPSEAGVGSKALLEFVIKSLVENPDEVHVEEIDHSNEIVLELSVNSSDMGRVIGKGGRVINAVRSLIQVSAAKAGKQVNVEIIE